MIINNNSYGYFLRPHLNADKAWQNGFYDSSVMPVKNKTGEILLKRDELIRGCLTAEKLAEMPPAFAKQGESGFDQMEELLEF